MSRIKPTHPPPLDQAPQLLHTAPHIGSQLVASNPINQNDPQPHTQPPAMLVAIPLLAPASPLASVLLIFPGPL